MSEDKKDDKRIKQADYVAKYESKLKASGLKAKKFWLNEKQLPAMRTVEKFIKLNDENQQKILDYISNLDNN